MSCRVGRSCSCSPMAELPRAPRLVITSLAPKLTMASRTRLTAVSGSGLLRSSRHHATSRTSPLAAALATSSVRSFSQLNSHAASNPASVFASFGQSSSQGGPQTYFSSKKRLPTNTIVRFVPQQTAWIVERMGKFNRILEPGLAVLVPVIDRIAYVRSLKENAIEIPSQSAITADNVTLELDGVLYTRVFDAYKAR
jgi:hypothetical protein